MGLPADAAESAASGTGLATVLLDPTTDQTTPMLTSVMSAYGCGPLRGYELDKQLRYIFDLPPLWSRPTEETHHDVAVAAAVAATAPPGSQLPEVPPTSSRSPLVEVADVTTAGAVSGQEAGESERRDDVSVDDGGDREQGMAVSFEGLLQAVTTHLRQLAAQPSMRVPAVTAGVMAGIASPSTQSKPRRRNPSPAHPGGRPEQTIRIQIDPPVETPKPPPDAPQHETTTDSVVESAAGAAADGAKGQTRTDKGKASISSPPDEALARQAEAEVAAVVEEDEEVQGAAYTQEAGRLGPSRVRMDVENAAGEIRFDAGALALDSQSNFSSCRATTAVFRGRWMFEVLLVTAGIQQLGWATLACPFTDVEGVGDAPDSYAYDGKRVKKWNVNCDPYGQPWMPGDVIGCCLDMEAGEITFYRNGASLGVAFKALRRLTALNATVAYFPAISLSHGERCELNFGSRPFLYPVPNFRPLQRPPTGAALRIAPYLSNCLSRLVCLRAGVTTRSTISDVTDAETVKTASNVVRCLLSAEDAMLVAAVVVKHLGPLLLDEYVVYAALLPVLLTLRPRPRAPAPVAHLCAQLSQLLMALLEPHEREATVWAVMRELGRRARCSFALAPGARQPSCHAFLRLAAAMCEHQPVLDVWTRSPGLHLDLEAFLSRKQPNNTDLAQLLPVIWWHGATDPECDERAMRLAGARLGEATAAAEQLQYTLCRMLLVRGSSHSPGDPKARGAVFKNFVRRLLRKNRGATRNVLPPGLSDPSVLACTYLVLLRLLRPSLQAALTAGRAGAPREQEAPVAFPTEAFLGDHAEFFDLPRLGGTLSHLIKTAPLQPEDKLPVQPVTPPPAVADAEVAAAAMAEKSRDGGGGEGSSTGAAAAGAAGGSSSGSDPFGWGLGMNIAPSGARAGAVGTEEEEEEEGAELVAIHFGELMDALMLLYHLGMSGFYKLASFQLQSQMQTVAQLDDTDRRIAPYATKTGDLVRHLKEARSVFRSDVVDSVRLCAWYRVTLFTRWKQAVSFSACSYMARLLLATGRRERVMAYVPELYVEAMVDAFHALRRGDPPFTPAGAGGAGSPAYAALGDIITFLVSHFNDPRIVNPDVRDVLLQSISVLLQYKEYVGAFQVNQAARDGMVEALLTTFDGRFWIPISNILLRLVKGSGFGQHSAAARSGKAGAEECSSEVFQRILCVTCESHPKLFSAFLNRIFNTLNWTITEFSVAMKEMNHAVSKRQANDLQHYQRKCTIMFELSVNLERILEFLTLHLWHVFLDADAEMNLTRLCESLVFLLNHTTCGPDARLFESTLQLQMQQLEKISRALILAPCAGIILNLHRAATARDAEKGGAQEGNTLVAMLAGMEASCPLERVEYVQDFNWRGAFPDDASLQQLPGLSDFLLAFRAEVERKRTAAARSAEEAAEAEAKGEGRTEPEEELCSICYASPLDTTFQPCKHQSCRRCINRQMLNSARCFFCNAAVEELQSMAEAAADAQAAADDVLAPEEAKAEEQTGEAVTEDQA